MKESQYIKLVLALAAQYNIKKWEALSVPLLGAQCDTEGIAGLLIHINCEIQV